MAALFPRLIPLIVLFLPQSALSDELIEQNEPAVVIAPLQVVESRIAVAPLQVVESLLAVDPLKVVEPLLADAPPPVGEPLLVVEETAPPGFEDIDEPQQGLVDIYNGGDFLLSAPAMYTESSLTFLHPEEIIRKIPYLLAPQKVLSLLSGELPAHTDRICLQRRQKNCGQLPADETGAIFDVDLHRADLFIAENLLTRKEAKAKFLPPSDAGWSFIVPYSLAVSDSSESSSVFSLNSETLISKGNTHLQSHWNYSEDLGFLAHDLSLRQDKEGREGQLGVFDTRGFGIGFLSDQLIAGSRYASTTRTRTDRAIAGGSLLSVLLNSRSRVEIIKDGRVLSSNMYDSGNQILDTSLLPDGAYDVVLRIEDSSGQVQEVKRFFSKSQSLPPDDQPLYFIEGGNLLGVDESALPQSSDHWLVKSGYLKRLRDNLGAHVTGAATSDQSVMELGSLYLSKFYRVDAVAMVTTTADYGFSLSGQTFFEGFSLYGKAELVDTHSPLTENSIQDDEFRLINAGSEQYSVRLALPFFSSQLNLSYILQKRTDVDDSSYDRNWSANINYPLFGMREHRLNLVSHFYHYEAREDDAFIGLQYTFSLPHWNHAIQYGARKNALNDDEGVSTHPLRMRSTWQDNERTGQGVDTSLYCDNGVEVDTTTLGAAVNYAFNGGRLRMAADSQRNDDPERDTFNRYNLNFNSNIAGDTENISWGGADRQRSAAIVKIESNEDLKEDFEIYVNNQQVGYADINKSTLLTLSPYESYDISIYPPPGSNYKYVTGKKSITVYPGNTRTFEWQVEKIRTIYGQVVDVHGEPITNASIKESDLYEGSDDYGIFQADIGGSLQTLTFVNDSMSCTVRLPAYDKTQFISSLGQLVCHEPVPSMPQ